MELLQEDIRYFEKGEHENPRFWSRVGGKPRLRGTCILDVGCGHGSLCIDMGLSGAKRVVGLDTNSQLIAFANENLRRNYPQLTDTVEFKGTDLKGYDECDFDYIVSKDTFEHIIHLDAMLTHMKRCLRPGGRIYAGFGPLYNSPFGDHNLTRTLLPWGHLLTKESRIIKRLNRDRKDKIDTIYDLGLNKMSLADYRRVFRESGLSIIRFRVNQSTSIMSKLFSLVRRVPPLEEYFSHNVYCILQRNRE
jgi:2-polyprenyl-3-methyl-5-hydroxy-6-metoxy-1,4-benzoquinol methylase